MDLSDISVALFLNRSEPTHGRSARCQTRNSRVIASFERGPFTHIDCFLRQLRRAWVRQPKNHTDCVVSLISLQAIEIIAVAPVCRILS